MMLASVGATGAALSACGNDQSVELNPTPFPDVAGAPPTLAPPPASPPAAEAAPTEAAAEAAPTEAAAEEAPAGGASAAGGASGPLALEAMDPYKWDKETLEAAPGQVIQVTNVGLSQHNFAVDEWGIEQDLPSGEPVEVTVPDDATAGATFVYYCSVPGHREGGMEGELTIIEAPAAGAAPEEAPAPAAGGAAPAASGGGGPITLEALDPYKWDKTTLEAAPGQVIQITNAGLGQHNFVVDEWEVEADLPSGEPVEVTVPDDATAGASFVYYCSVAGHREGGMEGTLTIV